ncbi:MAG: ECF-type sigma factor [Planctomycetaceae bacterium]|nr:ECF-type sigma factor [Planctomycetaceae bacterium]
MSDVTRILSQIDSGDPSAAEQLLPLVYDELRKLAAAKLAHEKPGQTLQATALVHEAYLRLVGSQGPGTSSQEPGETNLAPGSRPLAPGSFDSRGHFFAAAAEAMRRILVDNARRKQSRKHGGDWQRCELDELEIALPEIPEDVLALDEALTKLGAADPQAAELVRLRFFAGLPLAEAAEMLGVSPRTADRLWAYARAWLHQEIAGQGPTRDSS